MSFPQKSVAYIEIDDFLALENASQYKHEYLDGVVYAIQGEPLRGMAGGSAVHADLIRNLGFALHTRLRGTRCSVKMSDMRLRIADDAIFYPDVLVHCEPTPQPAIATTELTEARLVAEVLSPTTKQFDRGAKLQAYQRLASLEHVLLLSGMEQAAWQCHRGPGGHWGELQPWPRGTPLALPSLGLELAWDEVYAGVGLP
jgi:Uma2 family endonuclease